MTPENFRSLSVIKKLEVLEAAVATTPKSEIAEKLALSRFELSHLLRLSRLLSDVVRTLIEKNNLPEGFAKAITRLPHNLQEKVTRDALHKQWSVRHTEKEVKALLEGREAAQDSTYYRQLGDLIGDQIGNPVSIKPAKNNRGGELIIKYFDYADFDSIMERLSVKLPD